VEFSRKLRNDVLAGDITLSVRLSKRPQVKQGGSENRALGSLQLLSMRCRAPPALAMRIATSQPRERATRASVDSSPR
jgi:hypothetical protein